MATATVNMKLTTHKADVCLVIHCECDLTDHQDDMLSFELCYPMIMTIVATCPGITQACAATVHNKYYIASDQQGPVLSSKTQHTLHSPADPQC
jgi:hypothetical protein